MDSDDDKVDEFLAAFLPQNPSEREVDVFAPPKISSTSGQKRPSPPEITQASNTQHRVVKSSRRIGVCKLQHSFEEKGKDEDSTLICKKRRKTKGRKGGENPHHSSVIEDQEAIAISDGEIDVPSVLYTDQYHGFRNAKEGKVFSHSLDMNLYYLLATEASSKCKDMLLREHWYHPSFQKNFLPERILDSSAAKKKWILLLRKHKRNIKKEDYRKYYPMFKDFEQYKEKEFAKYFHEKILYWNTKASQMSPNGPKGFQNVMKEQTNRGLAWSNNSCALDCAFYVTCVLSNISYECGLYGSCRKAMDTFRRTPACCLLAMVSTFVNYGIHEADRVRHLMLDLYHMNVRSDQYVNWTFHKPSAYLSHHLSADIAFSMLGKTMDGIEELFTMKEEVLELNGDTLSRGSYSASEIIVSGFRKPPERPGIFYFNIPKAYNDRLKVGLKSEHEYDFMNKRGEVLVAFLPIIVSCITKGSTERHFVCSYFPRSEKKKVGIYDGLIARGKVSWEDRTTFLDRNSVLSTSIGFIVVEKKGNLS